MRSMRYARYGGVEHLALAEIPTPTPKDHQLLVRVQATSVNPIDWKLHTGMLRGVKPIRFPSTPCFDFAGTVAAVGVGVSEWAEGDAAFGMLPIEGLGAAAEFVTVDARYASRIPEGLDFQSVAGLPLAGMTALQALRDQGQLQSGQKLLIIGSAGGVGHYALQIGKVFGAHVTAICGSRNVDLCRELGADAVLDYTHEPFALPDAAFDLILDAVGQAPFSHWQPALKPAGRFVALLPSLSLGLAALKSSLFSRQRIGLTFVKPQPADLVWLADHTRKGTLRTVVDQIFPLPELPAALEKSRSGHARGKILIALAE